MARLNRCGSQGFVSDRDTRLKSGTEEACLVTAFCGDEIVFRRAFV